jgi:isopenicillin N synthase-like dioxygenase
MSRADSPRAIDAAEVPVIDIAALRDGVDAHAVGAQLAQAANEVGFLYVKNYGVDIALIEQARRDAYEFFRLPAAAKQAVRSNSFHHGYLRPGSSKMDDDARQDLKESFNWGIELDTLPTPGNALLGPNEWPPASPSLKAGLYPFFEAASACAEDLLRGFALGAGLDAEHFIAQRDLPLSRGSLQYYPPQPDSAEHDQFGVSPHTDFGVLTVLCQDDNGGLQLQLLSGEWVAVPPIPDTLVVNVGDLLERWSNGRYRSTVHRVINSSGKERLSLVLAYDPNFETLIDASAFCLTDETPRDEPIHCGDYLLWRFAKAFSYRQ